MEVVADYESNLEVEITPDRTKLRCFGSFFKSDWMTKQDLESLEKELLEKGLENNFKSEFHRVTNVYFLGLQKFLISKFEESYANT